MYIYGSLFLQYRRIRIVSLRWIVLINEMLIVIFNQKQLKSQLQPRKYTPRLYAIWIDDGRRLYQFRCIYGNIA